MEFARNRRAVLSFGLGLGVSAVALYFAFKNVPFDTLIEYFKTIRFRWIWPAGATVVAGLLLRALRWQLIVGAVRPVGFAAAYHPFIISFFANCVLPGRMGEILRPVVLSQRSGVPFSTGIATVATERLFDMVILLAAFPIVLAQVPLDSVREFTFHGFHLSRETLDTAVRILLRMLAVMGLGIVCLMVPAIRKRLNRLIMGVPNIIPFLAETTRERLREKMMAPIAGIMENVASGFTLLKTPGKLLGCVGLSALIWTLQTVSYHTLSLDCPGASLPFFQMYVVMILTCFFIVLPSVPGYWGLWEAGGVFAMSLFGIPAAEALGFTLLNHALQIFPVMLMGAVSVWITGVRWLTPRE